MNAQEFINYTNTLGSVLGLDSMKELLKQLGNPQDRCKVLHIAGTNGKGSIFAFVENIMRVAGYKVVRYISPTINTYLERFQVNGEYMSNEAFERYVAKVKPVCDQLVKEGYEHPTSFEVETAIAFLFAVEEKADLMLLETGMGGRLDATNVVAHPIGQVFASISMDHMNFLGDTVEQIAMEKAGILRANGQAVSYPQIASVKKVLANESERLKSTLTFADENQLNIVETGLKCSRFQYKKEEYEIHLHGQFQVYNAITAIEAVELLKNHFLITKQQVKQGLLIESWPGRFEYMSENPLVIRDGAHNIEAVEALKQTLIRYFPNQKFVFVMGILKDKEHEKMVETIVPLAKRVLVVTPDSERALPKNILAKEVAKYCNQVEEMNSIPEALANARSQCQKDEIIVVFGSLTIIGAVL